MRELCNNCVGTPTPVTQLQGKKSKPRMLFAHDFFLKNGLFGGV